MTAPPVPRIFDPSRRALRLQRALARQQRPGAASWLRETMAADAVERLGFLRWQGERALVSGDWGGTIAEYLAASGTQVERAAASDWTRPLAEGAFSLIVTLAELDTIDDLPGALVLARRALAPGGLLLAMFPGAGSLPQLRQTMLAADGDRPAARIHPQIDALAASGLLQRAGFARQAVDHYAVTVRFGALRKLVEDLRDQALTSVLVDRAPPFTAQALARASDHFARAADADGKTSERVEIVTLTAWRD